MFVMNICYNIEEVLFIYNNYHNCHIVFLLWENHIFLFIRSENIFFPKVKLNNFWQYAFYLLCSILLLFFFYYCFTLVLFFFYSSSILVLLLFCSCSTLVLLLFYSCFIFSKYKYYLHFLFYSCFILSRFVFLEFMSAYFVFPFFFPFYL